METLYRLSYRGKPEQHTGPRRAGEIEPVPVGTPGYGGRMVETLGAAEARRVFLNAQGLARRRPSGRAGVPRFREYLARQGVLQLDSVNVLARAHYLPVFSRYGPYPTAALDAFLWGSGETFEHWGHEASVMPRALLATPPPPHGSGVELEDLGRGDSRA